MNIPNLESFLAGYLAALGQQQDAGDHFDEQQHAHLITDLLRVKPLMTDTRFRSVRLTFKFGEEDFANRITAAERELLAKRQGGGGYDVPFLNDSMVALTDRRDHTGILHCYTIEPLDAGYFDLRYQRGTPNRIAPIASFKPEDFVVKVGPLPYYAIPTLLRFYGIDQPNEANWELREIGTVDEYDFLS